MTSTESLKFRIDSQVATVIMNRNHRRNALDRIQVTELIRCFDDAHSTGSVRAMILTGEGQAFCSGTDLHELKESMDSPDAIERWYRDTQSLLELVETMLRFPKPIICAVNGPVAGMGMALMLAADFAIASDSATFCLPESRRGLSTGLATPLLHFRVGSSAAAHLTLTGESISAQRGQTLGLCHEVVPNDFVWVRSFELAQQAALGARESHQMTKQMLNETIGETLLTQLSISAANMAAARTTGAAKEGVSAFLEKREPKW